MKLFYLFLSLLVIAFGIGAVYCMIVFMPAPFRGSIVHIACVLFVAFLTVYAGVKCIYNELKR